MLIDGMSNFWLDNSPYNTKKNSNFHWKCPTYDSIKPQDNAGMHLSNRIHIRSNLFCRQCLKILVKTCGFPRYTVGIFCILQRYTGVTCRQVRNLCTICACFAFVFGTRPIDHSCTRHTHLPCGGVSEPGRTRAPPVSLISIHVKVLSVYIMLLMVGTTYMYIYYTYA